MTVYNKQRKLIITIILLFAFLTNNVLASCHIYNVKKNSPRHALHGTPLCTAERGHPARRGGGELKNLQHFIVDITLAGAKELIQQIKEKAEYLRKKPCIVFLITKDTNNYEADKTVPLFAEILKREHGYKVSVLLGEGDHGSYRYPTMEALSQADLLVVFARRIALPHEQMKAIKDYLGEGKPLIGIRTANHAFTVSGKVEDGFEDWPAFVADILGCQNRGYGPNEPGTDVSLVDVAANHPIVKDLPTRQWHSKGSIYRVAPLLDNDATVLLTGKVNDSVEPIAWTRTAGGSKVFYTSLGYPADFQTPQFITLLVSGIKWALDKKE